MNVAYIYVLKQAKPVLCAQFELGLGSRPRRRAKNARQIASLGRFPDDFRITVLLKLRIILFSGNRSDLSHRATIQQRVDLGY